MSTDVGADILDMAETMITSNGLQYEPVSTASSYNLIHSFYLQTAYKHHSYYNRLFLISALSRDSGKGKTQIYQIIINGGIICFVGTGS